MKDIKLLIKGAKLPERSVMICLDQSLVADIEALERQLSAVNGGPDTASLEGSPRLQIERRIEALRQEMPDASIEFRFRALPRSVYSALLKEHPPRDGDKLDQANGINLDTFFEAVVRACCVAPELDEADWLDLLGDDTDEHPGVLSSGQFDVVAMAAWGVNRRDVDVPFSLADSQRLATSALGSKQPSDSASVSNGSTAGSRGPRRGTTTTPKVG